MRKYLIKIYEFLRKRYLFLKRHFIAPPLPKNQDGKIYLNLGCALNSSSEFTNIDVDPYPNIHHIQDITDLSNFADNSVDLVYASHVVEHLPKEKLLLTLREWKRVLKHGGIFRFAVPDFDKLIEIYHGNNNDIMTIRDQVLGQLPPYHNHYTLWNFNFAKKIMTETGFVNAKRWSPDTVEHHNFTDRSARAIKAGAKEIPLSLNVEVTKP